ncbi:MAG: FAD:protein FMN transferase [Omnitrophica bacterium]|nr:FAD:protein FMN transferase [Candidatus Omnitrophota bacterium]
MPRVKIAQFIPAILSSLLFISGCAKAPPYTKNFFLMDTFASIEIVDELESAFRERLVEKVISRMKKLERKFDYFSDDSELSLINRLRKKDKLRISDEMFRVLKRSKALYAQTSGVFDVSLGSGKWRLDEYRKRIYFTESGVSIDLGGIAKGFIVDEGIATLKKYGVRNALINAGGDMYCMGDGPAGNGWKVGVRDPKDSNKIVEILTVRNKGIATSGGYERFTETGGEKFSRIINPKTGLLVRDIYKSVTVVTGNCMTADALATAFYVYEPREAIAAAKRMTMVDCIIVDEAGGVHISGGFFQADLTNTVQ